MTDMEIYITDLVNNQVIQIPMLPETVDIQYGTNFLSYSILDIGDVKLPLGETVTELSWDGIFPGADKKAAPYIHGKWSDPKNLQNAFNVMRKAGDKLRVLITDTPINNEVYINTFEVKYGGGNSDYNYSINFTAAKKITVSTISTSSTSSSSTSKSSSRASAPKPKTVTVKKGDSLWEIAQKYLGNGKRYTDIYSLNKTLMDQYTKKNHDSKYTIYVGETLKLPG